MKKVYPLATGSRHQARGTHGIVNWLMDGTGMERCESIYKRFGSLIEIGWDVGRPALRLKDSDMVVFS